MRKILIFEGDGKCAIFDADVVLLVLRKGEEMTVVCNGEKKSDLGDMVEQFLAILDEGPEMGNAQENYAN